MTHFRLDVTITSITSITSGFCTDVTLDVHFQGATLYWQRGACLRRGQSRPGGGGYRSSKEEASFGPG